MFDAQKLPRVGIALVLGFLVLSFGFDMRQNPDRYEDRWAGDVTRSYGTFLIGVSILGVAMYLVRLSTQDENEDETPERTPVLVDVVSRSDVHRVTDRDQPLSFLGSESQRLPYLIGVTGGVPPKVALPKGTFIIGRSPTCDMVLSSQLVSRKHARIHWDGRVLKIIDLGSSNATEVNDEAVVGEKILQDGDIIQIVDYQMEVSLSLPDSLDATVIRTKDS